MGLRYNKSVYFLHTVFILCERFGLVRSFSRSLRFIEKICDRNGRHFFTQCASQKETGRLENENFVKQVYIFFLSQPR